MKFVCFFYAASADIYLHVPRGTNNRLNEASKERQNANRLFDSQNNNNGGYNVADQFSKPAASTEEQHQEMYFQSGKVGKSFMTIEWSSQHGCGKRDDGDTNAIDCHYTLQYKCNDLDADFQSDRVKNGFSTKSPQSTKKARFNKEAFKSKFSRKNKDASVNSRSGKERGQHESWENYDACRIRDRNQNLFIADQNVGNKAIHTRQNPNGQKSGYECPEERDYFPYWHPTEWTDIAVLTSNIQNCNLYQAESSNRSPKGECVEYYESIDSDDVIRKHASSANNPADCDVLEGTWLEFYDYLHIDEDMKSEDMCKEKYGDISSNNSRFIWGYPRYSGSAKHNRPEKNCLMLHPPIDCKTSPWSRANHLGNTVTGEFPQYRWELPYYPDNRPKECVFRMRYNISSNDYPENFDSNEAYTYYDKMHLTKNPKIISKFGVEFQLAIDTAQIARTFQDRSHVFVLAPRSLNNIPDDATIENIQVRGKRGNIVQTYPAVEYGFSPTRPVFNVDTLFHVQWAGSNSNPNENEGEGAEGTDRNNIITVDNINWNIPQGNIVDDIYKSHEDFASIFENVKWVWSSAADKGVMEDLNNLDLQMATSGYYECIANCDKAIENKPTLHPKLNNAAASYHGNVFKFNRGSQVYHFLSSRNNNFSNRAQKSEFTIT